MKTSEVKTLFLWGWHMSTAGNGQPDSQNIQDGEKEFLEWFEAEIGKAEDRGFDMGKFYGYNDGYTAHCDEEG